MSWGTELWDQYDNLSYHTQKGIDFCEKYMHFTKERIAIEVEYASKLKKLVKSYQPKRKEEDDYIFSNTKGFVNMINELHDIAGQHEVIAESLSTRVLKELQDLVNAVKQERKKHLQDGSKQMNAMQSQIAQMEKVKKQYEKSYKEQEKTLEAYRRADADINLSRAEVEKSKQISINKQQYCEQCKNEYAAELQRTNQFQQEHYHTLMPQIFSSLQDVDERRIARIQEFIKECAEIERNVIPIINTCIDGMLKAAEAVSPSDDSRLVVDKYKSGFQPPGDIPFEDLSTGITSPEQSNGNKGNTGRIETQRGTIGGKGKTRKGLLGLFQGSKTDEAKDDYSHLPPTQQRKKLGQKIDSLKVTIAKETAERDGMQKMKDVYQKNPALGDPGSIDKQLEENARKLDDLRQELQKYEGYLVAAEGKAGSLMHNQGGSHESLSNRSSGIQQNIQPVYQNDQTDAGVGSNIQAPFADDEFDDLPEIGKARAVYAFEAQSEGSIPMMEGEEFSIVEQDQGDGWTRVRRMNGEEGFVPTSYVEVTLY